VGRTDLFNINLKNLEIDKDVDIGEIVKETEGYSGADIANLCREAAYMPMRRKLKKEGGLGNKLADGKWKEEFEKEVNVPLNMNDFKEALKTTKPSVGKGDLKHYEEWMVEHG
jgi:SpoVK/Ycf46/Vps4 family AAA+-type ATPase